MKKQSKMILLIINKNKIGNKWIKHKVAIIIEITLIN